MAKKIILWLLIVLILTLFSCNVKNNNNLNRNTYIDDALKNKPCWVLHINKCSAYQNDNEYIYFSTALNYKHNNLKHIENYHLKLALSKPYVSILSTKIQS